MKEDWHNIVVKAICLALPLAMFTGFVYTAVNNHKSMEDGMKCQSLFISLLSWLLFSPLVVALTGDPVAGKAKTQVCVACHDIDGNSTANPAWPKIAGQHIGYFIKQMKDYSQGDEGPRPNAIMLGMVANLTDQDFADLAAYYATQKQTIGTAKEALFALGEKIYRGGNLQSGVAACVACHGPKGEGNGPANFPRVGGQHAQYLGEQLQAFKSDQRHNSPNRMMEMVSKRMTDEEIEAVSSYIEGLH